ncbi:hypothetical protein ACH4EC_11560 [Streptomyces anulatus]
MPLLVIATGVEGEALSTLLTNQLWGAVRGCTVAVAGGRRRSSVPAGG